MTDQAQAGPDTEELTGYLDTWWSAIDDFTTYLEGIAPEQWASPTRLQGWTVHDIAAHTGHLEHLLAGGEHDDIDVGQPAHVKNFQGTFTEQGVVARRDRSADDLINEIRESATARRTSALATPPADGSAPAPGLFGAIGWNLRTLLRNRPLDVWLHEQDVREALGDPGNMNSAAAVHTADYLAESLSYVLAKKAKAPAGTSVVLHIEGHEPITASVNEEGRGVRSAGAAADADATLSMNRATFVTLAGGRGDVAPDAVAIEGDEQLASHVLANFAVTP